MCEWLGTGTMCPSLSAVLVTNSEWDYFNLILQMIKIQFCVMPYPCGWWTTLTALECLCLCGVGSLLKNQNFGNWSQWDPLDHPFSLNTAVVECLVDRADDMILIKCIFDYMSIWLSVVCILINAIEVKMFYSKILISSFFQETSFLKPLLPTRNRSRGNYK